MGRRHTLVLGIILSSLAAQPAWGGGQELSTGPRPGSSSADFRALRWSNSTVTYENVVSALSFARGAELTYDPYYAQSISLRPRYALRDDLELAMRLDLEIELTTSDETDRAREWLVSDLSLDLRYAPPQLTIPFVDVHVSPSLRLYFPTSKVSRGRSMIMGIAPGLALHKRVPLLRRPYLSSLDIGYGFRATKFLHEYTLAQLDTTEICALTNPENPACLHSGLRNRTWRLANIFEARLQLFARLALTADLMLFNDLLYELPATAVALQAGPLVELEASQVNHRASLWAFVELSYDVLDWLGLAIGISSATPQLAPDSRYYAPLINRFTTFYLDVTVPVDRLAWRVQQWLGKGR